MHFELRQLQPLRFVSNYLKGIRFCTEGSSTFISLTVKDGSSSIDSWEEKGGLEAESRSSSSIWVGESPGVL